MKRKLTKEAEIFEIVKEIEIAIDDYYYKLAPNKLQLKNQGKLVKFYEGRKEVFGTVVSGYLNDENHPYLFSAYHILTVDGKEVTVLAKDVVFVK